LPSGQQNIHKLQKKEQDTRETNTNETNIRFTSITE